MSSSASSSSDDERSEALDINKTMLAVRVNRGLDMPVKKEGEERITHCIVSLNSASFETDKFEGSAAEPVWNETFYFDVTNIQIPAPDVFIVVEIFTNVKHSIKKIGVVKVPIDNHIDIKFQKGFEHFYPVAVDPDNFKTTRTPTLGLLIGVSDALDGGAKEAEKIKIYTEEELNSMTADQIYEAATDVAQKSLALLDRIERMANQSEQIGAATAKQLMDQTEQLKIIDMKIESLHQHIDEGVVILEDIDSCCLTRCFVVCCAKKKQKKQTKKRAKQAMKFEKEIEESTAETLEQRQKEKDTIQKEQDKAAKKADRAAAKEMKKNPPLEEGTVRRTEQEKKYRDLKKTIDQRLDRLQQTVGRLKEIAIAIGDQLDVQNERINRLDAAMEDGQMKLAKANIKTKKLT
eukprot:TRINITY_DN10034_c0_g1_i1.p1 TRINITY_DN10034_c0_g1~~TRINITY_DN10034_c0_g1_i1.p1  ORF type:complete len:406 (+),score=160.71 TRINITY_DN10034_c0_g1_i1:44-1261(+)